MATWREDRTLSLRFPKGKYAATASLGKDKHSPCSVKIYEYTGEKTLGPFGWKFSAENTVVLELDAKMTAEGIKPAKELAKQLLEKVAGGELTPIGRHPYHVSKSELVRAIEHESKIGKAGISKWDENRYEVTIAVWAPDASYMPMSTPSISSSPDMGWGRVFNEHVYFDNLPEAEQFAIDQLEISVVEAQRLTQEHELRKAAKSD